jgi:quercetin dioxygenase-like cupin family protein
MGLVTFDGDQDNWVTAQYSTARGPVLRSEHCELAKVFFAKGTGAEWHHHPEEQTFYCLEGRLEVWLGEDEPYIVEPGEASFHPSDVPHRVQAHEDTSLISFKIRASDQIYQATGALS